MNKSFIVSIILVYRLLIIIHENFRILIAHINARITFASMNSYNNQLAQTKISLDHTQLLICSLHGAKNSCLCSKFSEYLLFLPIKELHQIIQYKLSSVSTLFKHFKCCFKR